MVIAIFSVYMPASGAKDNLCVSLVELESIIEGLGDEVIPIVCGDFNGDIGSKGGIRVCKPPTKAGVHVLNFMKRQSLTAINMTNIATGNINTFECHNGKSTLDYIMVPTFVEDCILKCHVGAQEEINTSDHFPVSVTLNVGKIPRLTIPIAKKERIKWDKWDSNKIRRYYQHPLEERLDEILEDVTYLEGSEVEIEVLFDRLVSALHEAAKVLPRAQFRRNLKPYWSDELNNLKKNKMFWFKKWKEEGRTLDPNDPVRYNMKTSKKLFVKTLRSISRQYEEDRIAEAAKAAEFDRDSFWRFFKRMKSTGGSTTHAVKNARGKVVYKLDEILEVWRGHFDALSTPKRENRFDNQHHEMVSQTVREWTLEDGISDFLEVPFSDEELKRAIQKLNQGKTPGFDGITAEHIKLGGGQHWRRFCVSYLICVC